MMVSHLLHAEGAEHCFMMLPLHLSASAEHSWQECNARDRHHCARMHYCGSTRVEHS